MASRRSPQGPDASGKGAGQAGIRGGILERAAEIPAPLRAPLREGARSEALADLKRALEVEPPDPRALHALGSAARRLSLPGHAEDALRSALKCDAAIVEAWSELAAVLEDTGRLDEAREILEGQARRAPSDAWLSARLARVLVRTGNAPLAVEALEAARSGGAGQSWWHMRLGEAHAASGNAVRAEAELREALALDPASSEAHHRLGRLLVSRGREEEGRPYLDRHRLLRSLETDEERLLAELVMDGDAVSTLVELAHVRCLLGRGREALAALERASRLEPGGQDQERIETLRRELSAGAGPSR